MLDEEEWEKNEVLEKNKEDSASLLFLRFIKFSVS